VVAAAAVVAAGRRLTGVALLPLVGLALLAGAEAANDVPSRPALSAVVMVGSDAFLTPGLRYAVDRQAVAGVIERYAIVRSSGPRPSSGPADGPSPLADLWPSDFWTADFSWAQTVPALMAMLCFAGLLAAVTVALPVEAPDRPFRNGF
jgi:hypothetical protein